MEAKLTQKLYAAFGDSMSIDLYPRMDGGVGFPLLLTRNNDLLFSDYHGRDLASLFGVAKEMVFAEDDSTTREVLHSQIPHFARLLKTGRFDLKIVTLTLGGNNLLMSLVPGGQKSSIERALECFRQDLKLVLENLCSFGAPVFVGDIYDPSDGSGDFSCY